MGEDFLKRTRHPPGSTGGTRGRGAGTSGRGRRVPYGRLGPVRQVGGRPVDVLLDPHVRMWKPKRVGVTRAAHKEVTLFLQSGPRSGFHWLTQRGARASRSVGDARRRIVLEFTFSCRGTG